VGFISNTLYTVDINPKDGRPHVIATTPTGQYPFTVIASPDGKRVYVSNWGEYNPGSLDETLTGISGALALPLVPPPATIAGYNTPESSSVWSYNLKGRVPSLAVETPIGHQLNGTTVDSGSQPSALALSPDGKTLAVTSSNDDLIELLDITRTAPATELPDIAGGLGSGLASLVQHPARAVDLRVLDSGPTGAEPDAVTWSSDGRVLLVAEGGRNSVAILNPAPAQTGTQWWAASPPRGIPTASSSAGTGDGCGSSATTDSAPAPTRTSPPTAPRSRPPTRTPPIRRPTAGSPTWPTTPTPCGAWCSRSTWPRRAAT
jgi:DNA-binding beta-propeller fold protein YncE